MKWKYNNGRCRSEPLTNLPLPAKGHQVSLAQKFPSRAKHKLIGDNCLFIVKVSQLYQRTYMITGAVRLTPGVLLGPMLSVLHTPPLLSVSGSLSVFTGITFMLVSNSQSKNGSYIPIQTTNTISISMTRNIRNTHIESY